MEKDTQLINVRVKRKLWHKVKIKVVLEGKTITQWLTEILEKEVGNG
jgi:predicted DNA binding CopG/RHH family protein